MKKKVSKSVKLGLVKLSSRNKEVVKNRIRVTESVENCMLGTIDHDALSIKWLVSFQSSDFDACIRFDDESAIRVYSEDSKIIISIPISKIKFSKDELARTIEMQERIQQFTEWVEHQWLERCGK